MSLPWREELLLARNAAGLTGASLDVDQTSIPDWAS